MSEMFFKYLIFRLAVAAQAIAAPTAAKAPVFILAGDSTTAVQSMDGGGWGNGFISFLESPAWGVNKGHNGATTVSFVAGGDWAVVKGYVSENAASYDPYVTIQFGHNDQKAASNISLAQYQTNLQNLATDILNLGGTPLLVTPMTRRSFTSEHVAVDDLHDQRLATIAAAQAVGVTYLDLNQESLTYVDAIGEDAAHVYNLIPTDNTHLNDYGSIVFGRMVADLLIEKRRDLEGWVIPNHTLSDAIANGQPA
ncbi:SGNH hydrolase-type esterase domain-containing protein [Xylariaceae sp. FL1019]|nr:SGNH hydrolase-type esterase domain-containing protein [Xylariaceae sp. FL1019]